MGVQYQDPSRKEAGGPLNLLLKRVISGGAGSLLVKGIQVATMFAITLFLAQALGPAGYGSFAFALAWTVILGLPAVLGMEWVVVRTVATLRVQNELALVRPLVRRASVRVLLSATIIALIGGGLGWLLLPRETRAVFLIAMALVPILALVRIRRSAMQGLDRVVLAQLPEAILHPLLFLGVTVAAFALSPGIAHARAAMALYVVAALAAAAVGWFALLQTTPAPEESSRTPVRAVKLGGSVSLVLISGMFVINNRLDIIMLGALTSTFEAGIYDVTVKIAEVLVFMLAAFNMALQPAFAGLYAQGRNAEIQALASRVARNVLILTIPLALVLAVAAGPILAVFGADFIQGSTALRILVLAQVFNVFMGSVGVLLLVTGNEADAARGIGISIGINALLNWVLIPIMGMAGAAVATATSVVVWNILLGWSVRRKLGIWAHAFARTKRAIA